MIETYQKIKEDVLAKYPYGKEVRKAVFINPLTGKEEEYVLFGQRDWSVIMPVTQDKKVVTVLQFKQGCNKIIHELPAGTADFTRESPEATARRELMEETGYKADKVIFLGPSLWMSSRNSWTKAYCFLASDCEKVREGKFDEMEVIETKLVPLPRWIEMARTEIEEPSAIVTTFRALPHLDL